MKSEHDGQRILVVDDDPRLIRLVREVLCAAGYDVLTRVEGQAAIEAVAVEQPALVVLDILLNDVDGYHVCRRVREFSDVPIIMLTGRATEVERLRGFDAGADDYITKPFSSKELLARIRAVLKRAKGEAGAPSGGAEIVCADLRIDLARHRVVVRGQEVHLTPTEYSLLHELARHPNQVLLHEQLLSAVWGPEYRNDVDYLRAYIRYLRQKIEADPANPKLIQRCPGIGYMLVCEGEARLTIPPADKRLAFS
jgi:two-component system KDP operon response regulator KdpE